ncbi:polysaccharide biosynthesis protein [Mariniflexile sp.]|uniref:polysaccharide biosynthesis protein n=1 Tax=Mariniflexile sp. TaxID=1979402 RepID=UPI003565B40C
MNKNTYNHIRQLIEDSGLIRSFENEKKEYHSFDFSNETILITGAAGSVGSELSKQIVAGQFKKLILIDVAESPLYNLYKDFENEELSKIEFILLNIKEQDELKYVFETYKPTIIFHAAAYKHVPLMEAHPYEAIKTNILATKLLADLSINYEVKKFIFISTDKAVNAISVMGISKRIAENYLIQQSQSSNTIFSIARFGNIMGSNGSVLPIFIKQIESHLPLTITSNSITRYFIGKHKACHLILQLATFNKMESNLFTFNMGEPIKLIDIVEVLTKFYPKETIEMEITGLRPGEKHEETMISEDEFIIPTENEAILQVMRKPNKSLKIKNLNDLEKITPYQSSLEIKRKLKMYL